VRVEAADVRRAVSLLPLVPRPPEPRKTARNRWQARCPFHEDNSPSMSVSQLDSGWVFNCFGCGEHGDVITYVMKIEGIDFKTALAKLGEGREVDVPPRWRWWQPDGYDSAKRYVVPCEGPGAGPCPRDRRQYVDLRDATYALDGNLADFWRYDAEAGFRWLCLDCWRARREQVQRRRAA
jgi:hypothetical protein